jgi:hypothetical protein
VITKNDFEKTYDKVEWSFLQHILRMKGPLEDRGALIHYFVTGGSVALKFSDDIDKYFESKMSIAHVILYIG